jgi:hypothetical protein
MGTLSRRDLGGVLLGLVPKSVSAIPRAKVEALPPELHLAARRIFLVDFFSAYRIGSHGSPHNAKGKLQNAEWKFAFFILHFDLIS